MEHYCLSVPLAIVVWIYDTSDNAFGVDNDFYKIFGEEVFGNVLFNISPSSIFLSILLPASLVLKFSG